MANDYLTITTSDGNTYKFRAIGFKPKYSPARTVEKTVNGMLDITHGNVYNSFQYVLRVPYVAPEVGDGTYANLVMLYSLNNPSGTPSSTFMLTDHWGANHSLCVFYGEMAPEPITTIIDGNYAWFIVPVEIVIDNIVFDSLSFFSAEESMYIPLIF